MSQSITGAWGALVAALEVLHPQDQVSAGEPGQFLADLIVAVMGVRAPVTRPTMGTNRSRDEQIEIDVYYSQYMPGGPEAQQPANQAAWAASQLLVDYFRTSPNETLGGACYNAWVSNRELTLSTAWEPTDGMSPVAAGRVAEIKATVTASVRT